MAALSLYGGTLPVLMLPLIGGTYEILHAPMGEFLRRLSARATPDLGMPQLTDVQVDALAELFIFVLPGAVAAYWLGIFALNLYLAARVARASGRLGRDWPDLPSLAYPVGFQLVLVVALAATFVPGVMGVAGVGLSGALLLAYFLAGLALMHHIARARAPWILWLVYVGVLFIEPYTFVLLMFAGLLEPAVKLRQRFGKAPPPRHPPETINHGHGVPPYASHSSRTHRPPRPDGRRRQRQGRLRPQLPPAAEEGPARHGGEHRPLREANVPSSRRAISS